MTIRILNCKELLETSSAYVEYLELIDQTPEAEVEDDTDTPEADTEDSTFRSGKFNFINMILNIIKSIIEMIIFITVPIKQLKMPAEQICQHFSVPEAYRFRFSFLLKFFSSNILKLKTQTI